MLFTIGTRIQLIHTDDIGVVTKSLENGMIEVRLEENGLEIPVFPEDIRRLPDGPSSVKARIVPAAMPKAAPKAPPREAATRQYGILKPQGVQLAFDPVLKKDQTPEGYRLFLINDLAIAAIYSCSLYLKNSLLWKVNGQLSSMGHPELKGITFEQLNDSLEIDLEVWPLREKGTGSRLHRRLKIKPKVFFKNVRTAPLLDRPVHLFRLFENLQAAQTAKPNEDIRSYTQRLQIPTDWRQQNLQRLPHEVEELAHFESVIDLHIEQLVDHPRKLLPGSIITTQLAHFDRYMQKAIRIGVERVFIIHGLGEGRLKAAIHERLAQMREVAHYTNEYHPKFGWGATEVVF